MPPELSDEHVAAICRVLIDHGVKFVIIGGMAARLHDTEHATIDVDICPSTDDANLARIASPLSDLGARLSGVGGSPVVSRSSLTPTCFARSGGREPLSEVNH